MKILIYDAKSYDIESFSKEVKKYKDIELDYIESDLDIRTASLVEGHEAVCGFVSSDFSAEVIAKLAKKGVKLILLRCAGFNNVDIEAAKANGISVFRVPGYSPEAVAEHAMALALAVNRKIHKAYIKVRENDFSLDGLKGRNLHGKVAGIIGTGKIGAAMARICAGFGMRVIAYDKFPNKDLKFIEYMSLHDVLAQADLISIHCPLTDENYHMINKKTITTMKDGVILVNTSRGELVDTDDLIQGIRAHKFHGVGLDVYEEERNNVFENRSHEILETSITSRLVSFPNVIVTSHQAFFTEEALSAISETTLQNAKAFIAGKPLEFNQVK